MTRLETIASAIAAARDRGEYPADIRIAVPHDRIEALRLINGKFNGHDFCGAKLGQLLTMSLQHCPTCILAVMVLFAEPRLDRPEDQYVAYSCLGDE